MEQGRIPPLQYFEAEYLHGNGPASDEVECKPVVHGAI